MTKKAQTWIFDYLAGFLMFVFLLIIAINLLQSIDARSDYDVVSREADLISVSLMSEGFPSDWNYSSVVMPGILSEGQINMSKLDKFDSFSYERTKALFHVSGEYWLYFKNASGIMEVNGECVRGFHFDGCEVPEVYVNHDDRAWVERIVVLDSQIVNMVVLTWR